MNVTVVGAGIIGCSAAAFLAEAGAQVTVHDRAGIAAGASGRNCGVLQHPLDDRARRAGTTRRVALHREVARPARRARRACSSSAATSTDGLPAELRPESLDDAREAEPLVIARRCPPSCVAHRLGRRADRAHAGVVAARARRRARGSSPATSRRRGRGHADRHRRLDRRASRRSAASPPACARASPRGTSSRRPASTRSSTAPRPSSSASSATSWAARSTRPSPTPKAVGRRLRERARPFIGVVGRHQRPRLPAPAVARRAAADRADRRAHVGLRGPRRMGLSTGPRDAPKLVDGRACWRAPAIRAERPAVSRDRAQDRIGGAADDREAMLDIDACLRHLVQSPAAPISTSRSPSPPLVAPGRRSRADPRAPSRSRRRTPSTPSTTMLHGQGQARRSSPRSARSTSPTRIDGTGRFRVNAFHQRGAISIVCRAIPFNIRTIDELALPPVIRDLAEEERGIILVTGTTGSGKSTTLAAMIDHMNETHLAAHRHDRGPDRVPAPRQALDHQPARGRPGHPLVQARAAPRPASGPGRASSSARCATRRRSTPRLSAAETGHLVLSTVHTVDAPETINRIIDFFPPHMHQQVRAMLGGTLKGVISQRLVPLDGRRPRRDLRDPAHDRPRPGHDHGPRADRPAARGHRRRRVLRDADLRPGAVRPRQGRPRQPSTRPCARRPARTTSSSCSPPTAAAARRWTTSPTRSSTPPTAPATAPSPPPSSPFRPRRARRTRRRSSRPGAGTRTSAGAPPPLRRGCSCGSLPSRGGMLPAGGGGVAARVPEDDADAVGAVAGRAERRRCPGTARAPGVRVRAVAVRGRGRGASTGRWTRAPIVRASTSVVMSATWWSPKPTCSSTLCVGVFGSGSAVMWCA